MPGSRAVPATHIRRLCTCLHGALAVLTGAAQVVVGLGEAYHGSASLNARKSAVLDSLARNDPASALVVESSFVGAIAAHGSDLDLGARMRTFVYPYWLTDTVVRTFARAERRVQDRAAPFLWGCDLQEDCRFSQHTEDLLRYAELATWKADLLRCDSVLDAHIGDQASASLVPEADRRILVAMYSRIAEQLAVDTSASAQRLAQAMRNRRALCDYLALSHRRQRMRLRDSVMAANILWLRDHLRTSGTLVFWAADDHVLKGRASRKATWCGERLAPVLGGAYVTISVRHGRRVPRGCDQLERVSERTSVEPENWRTPCP